MYLYNVDTGALHIDGLCQHSKCRPTHAKYFETEKEAYDYCGQKVFFCRICQKKRDTLMKEEFK